MESKTIYLITGANRGIGLSLLTTLLLRPSTTVIATVRSPSSSSFLSTLPHHPTSSLIILPLDLTSPFSTYTSLITTLTHLNTVISNAGDSRSFRSILDTEEQDIRHDFEVNALGPWKLLKACAPLLIKMKMKENSGTADETPSMEDFERKEANKFNRFFFITSSVGSIEGLSEENFPSTAYGMSKCAGNWLAKKASLEFAVAGRDEKVDQDQGKRNGFLIGVIHPGWVKTKMGRSLATTLGVDEPPMTVEQSAIAVQKLIDDLSPETSGKFLSWNGDVLPW